jgi:hypothetical protein
MWERSACNLDFLEVIEEVRDHGPPAIPYAKKSSPCTIDVSCERMDPASNDDSNGDKTCAQSYKLYTKSDILILKQTPSLRPPELERYLEMKEIPFEPNEAHNNGAEDKNGTTIAKLPESKMPKKSAVMMALDKKSAIATNASGRKSDPTANAWREGVLPLKNNNKKDKDPSAGWGHIGGIEKNSNNVSGGWGEKTSPQRESPSTTESGECHPQNSISSKEDHGAPNGWDGKGNSDWPKTDSSPSGVDHYPSSTPRFLTPHAKVGWGEADTEWGEADAEWGDVEQEWDDAEQEWEEEWGEEREDPPSAPDASELVGERANEWSHEHAGGMDKRARHVCITTFGGLEIEEPEDEEAGNGAGEGGLE